MVGAFVRMSDWQLVLALWGDKYSVDDVNRLISAVRRHASKEPRIVLITDSPRNGLVSGVIQKPFPLFYTNPSFQHGGGCQAKLAMFEKGVVPDDRPAIYVDLDTAIFGDLSEFLRLLSKPKTIAIFQSGVLPFGRVSTLIWRLTDTRWYAHGNSSIIVYHPRESTHIAERFREATNSCCGAPGRALVADDRFMSWVAQPYMRSIPLSMAVKFPSEFMFPSRWLIHLRAAMPWLRRRWSNLIAITLPGSEVTGPRLVELDNGALVANSRGRILIWSDWAVGEAKSLITNYYKAQPRQ